MLLADAGSIRLDDVVELARYPIHDSEHSHYRELVARCQSELAEDGCSVIRGFIRPEAMNQARTEGRALAPKATFQKRQVNAYTTDPDPSLPEDDPRNIYMWRTSGFVTRDMIAADTVGHRLYVSPALKRFVADCVGSPRVFEYADPFAGLVMNVLPEGARQPWHYDTNEFVATLQTQAPEDGGVFEYCPNIRRPGDENLEAVSRVLRGHDRERVRRLTLRPGDLQLFRGRYSLHQVSTVRGARARHSLVFAYAERPGVVGPVARTRQLYGRVAEAHLIAEKERQSARDGLIY